MNQDAHLFNILVFHELILPIGFVAMLAQIIHLQSVLMVCDLLYFCAFLTTAQMRIEMNV